MQLHFIVLVVFSLSQYIIPSSKHVLIHQLLGLFLSFHFFSPKASTNNQHTLQCQCSLGNNASLTAIPLARCRYISLLSIFNLLLWEQSGNKGLNCVDAMILNDIYRSGHILTENKPIFVS
jgi:hypothetical protein